ncbi:hypothetical protein BH09BAC1_BH09BAC1_12470 [soil metagenome]
MKKNYKELPVFKKAQEILEITTAITDAIDEEEDIFHMKEFMMNNATIMTSKIVGAEGGDLYSLRMENAVLIKLAACELKTQTNMLRIDNLTDGQYIQLLRDEIDNFKPLFIDWVKSFDPTDDINDGWLYIMPPREGDGEGF